MKANVKDGQSYVWIPPGSFEMGCSPGDSECGDEEKPMHWVIITKGFWMGQTPATVGVWKKYRNATGAAELGGRDILGRILNENAGNDALPAVGMTWDEATSYCEWSGGRLPTESEWEYAARAGTTGARYGALDGIAWYGDNSGRERIDSAALHAHAYAVQGTAQIAQTRDVGPVSIVTTATFPKVLGGYYQKLFENGNAPRPVGLKLPNAWNLYDVLGDVWQWTGDWGSFDSYPTVTFDPQGPPKTGYRSLRGGSCLSPPGDVRLSSRHMSEPGESVPAGSREIFGVRCLIPRNGIAAP